MPIKQTNSFTFWVKQTLPSIYSDALSYYELLEKVIEFLNSVIEQNNALTDFTEKELKEMRAELADFLTTILPDNLEAILDEWFLNGRLAEIINNQVFDMKANSSEIPWVTPFKYQDKRIAIASGWDWTPAIQYALDNHKFVFIPWTPDVHFQVTQLVVPNGVTLRGIGLGSFGYTGYASKLTQIAGTHTDMIIFKADSNAGDLRVWVGPLEISGLILFGDPSAVKGSGIHVRTPTNVKATIQDTVIFQDLLIRGFRDDGITFTDGALPLNINRVNFLYNGRYGINFQTANFVTQGVHFSNISGDGNLAGLVRIKGAKENGSITFTNVKSEKRVNSMFGNAIGQENVIIFEECDSTPVTINGITHISSVPDVVEPLTRSQRPGSAIVLMGSTTPKIFYSGIAIRVRTTDRGDIPNVIQDNVYNRSVSMDYTSGYFGTGDSFNITNPTDPNRRSFFGKEWLSKNVEAGAIQMQGTTPSYGLYATGGTTDQKAWLESASGGNLIKRTVNDDGTTGMIYETIRRTGNQITKIDMTVPTKQTGVELTPRNAVDVINNSLFIDITDNKLKFKTTTGAPLPNYLFPQTVKCDFCTLFSVVKPYCNKQVICTTFILACLGLLTHRDFRPIDKTQIRTKYLN